MLYSTRKRKYRVVSRTKFVASSIIITSTITAMLIGLFILGSSVYSTFAKKGAEFEPHMAMQEFGLTAFTTELIDVSERVEVIEEAEDRYRIVVGDTIISSNNVNDYIDKLETELVRSVTDSMDYAAKYEKAMNESRALYEKDIHLYNEFSYVIQHPTSDFTLEDVKMVIDLTEEYGGVLDPHLWFSLVELESSYRSNARSTASTASGWGQVLQGTGKWLYEKQLGLGRYNHSWMGVDKEINARLSIYYLSDLINTHGVKEGLLRYNGYELGQRYIDIVTSKLKNNAGRTFNQVVEIASMNSD